MNTQNITKKNINIIRLIQFVIVVYGLLSLFLQKSYTQPLKNPVSVVISKDDVKMLGGWPIERRWYGIVMQNLRNAGVKRIFIDIAFPTADILHPESDDFVYKQLIETPQTYLLFNDIHTNEERYIVFGSKALPPERFIAPFSKGFSVSGNKLEFAINSRTLVDFFIQSNISADKVLVDLPSIGLQADYTFEQALHGGVICADRDVVVYLDFPGITSYVMDSHSRTFSTSSLQLWTIQQIQSGNFKTLIPLWELLSIFVLILLPIGFSIITHRIDLISVILSLVLWFGVSIGLVVFKIHLDYWWIFTSVPSVGFAFVYLFSRLKIKGFLKPSLPQDSLTIDDADHKTEQMKELQHRLEYYERLSNQIPTDELKEGFESHGIFCHKSSPLIEILRKAELVAKNDIPVLIRGESGSGKEVLAQFIHRHSDRRDQPIIAVNCGALNDNLIEAELFGYEKGAFTGAFQQKPGRFEMAHGGTLFLDEVSETSLAFQVKLLRVIQEGVIERVGGTKSIPVSVRLITATHQDLTKAIQRKTFREDLYYRLNGYQFVLPPMRERPMDVEYLFKHFLFEIDSQLKYSEPLIEWLKVQPWPGNVRQLKAATQRAVINAQLRKRSFLIPKDFELAETKNDKSGATEQLADQILRKLRDYEFHHRSISAAASDLMIHRSTVTEYLRGWTIKFLNEGSWDHEFVLTSLRGTAPVSDEDQLKNRVKEYISYNISRIDDGLRELQTDEQILATKFRNLPQVFKNDLMALIQKKRLMNEGVKDGKLH